MTDGFVISGALPEGVQQRCLMYDRRSFQKMNPQSLCTFQHENTPEGAFLLDIATL
ncbi:hypothetical protein ACO0K3_18250 [Undibacterium sp. Rencai35W]